MPRQGARSSVGQGVSQARLSQRSTGRRTENDAAQWPAGTPPSGRRHKGLAAQRMGRDLLQGRDIVSVLRAGYALG